MAAQRRLGGFALFCLGWSVLAAGGDSRDHYLGVKIPYHENRVLRSEIHAEEADAAGLASGVTIVNMRGVKIHVYDSPAAGEAEIDKPPLLRMVISANQGNYRRLKRGAAMDDQATLETNVRVIRFADLRAGADENAREVETEMICERAVWSQRDRTLKGDGKICIRQRGCELTGTDFIYRLHGEGGADKDREKNLPTHLRRPQGWIEIEREVKMRFRQEALSPSHGSAEAGKGIDRLGVDQDDSNLTTVTCQGLASYDLTARELQFQDNVVVDQPRLVMTSDRLRVVMEKADPPVREIIGWGNVRFQSRGEAEENGKTFGAEGNYARYVRGTQQILLTDAREGKLPEVRLGENRISDRLIQIEFKNDGIHLVRTEGGQGSAVLHALRDPFIASNGEKEPGLWEIRYDKSLLYEHTAERAEFRGNVLMARGDLRLETDRLQVAMAASPSDPHSRAIKEMRAEGAVRFAQGARRGTANIAEIDINQRQVILLGPPAPWIIHPGRSRLQASRLEMRQVEMDEAERPLSVIRGEGPCCFVFLPVREAPTTEEDDLVVQTNAVTIRCSGSMLYDEPNRMAHFADDVVASTEATADAWVLRSEKLDVMLEGKTAAEKAEQRLPLRRISAAGNATLHWERRHGKAEQIIRDWLTGVITMHGSANAPAEVWEDGGNSFRAPRIVATVDGETIRADGPGELGLPDNEGLPQAKVTYTGEAVYRSFPNGTGKALFRRNVVMQRGDLFVRGDEMEADLEQDAAAASADGGAETALADMPRRLRRAVVRGRVVVTRGQRTAKGAVGELLVRATGDVINLKGTPREKVEVEDREGVRLLAPAISVAQASSVVTAEGPGEVRVTSIEPLRGVAGSAMRQENRRPVDYLLQYDGQLLYNQLACKVKFSDNVRLKEENLEGRSDRLEMTLVDAPGIERGEAGLQVRTIEAQGDVRFKRFEPAKTPAERKADPLDREGRTVFTKSAEARYDAVTRKLRIAGGPPPPMALQQTLSIDDDGQIKRTRMQLTADEYIELDVDKGDVKAYPRPKFRYQPAAGPLRFED